MFTIDLLYRADPNSYPETTINTLPDAESEEAALEAGRRVLKTRGREVGANGFRVAVRGSGKFVHLEFSDAEGS